MIFAAMHWFMKFWNCRYQLGGRRNPKLGGPMIFHSLKDVYEPLTGDVIAYDDKQEGKHLDHHCEDKVHVGISVNMSALIAGINIIK